MAKASDSGSDVRDRLTQAIVELLERHGVSGDREQQTLLQTLFEQNSKYVTRRLAGESPWWPAEVRAVAQHFGEAPAALWAHAIEPDAAKEATLLVDGRAWPCRIWLGDPVVASPDPPVLVAIPGDAGDLRVVRSDQVEPGGARARLVRTLVLGQSPSSTPAPAAELSVAIVDDDPDVADSVAANLGRARFRARAFHSTAAFRRALQGDAPFDAVILDWLVGGDDPRTTLELVRRKCPRASVVVLTGQVASGGVSAAELTRAASDFDAQLLEKPAKTMELIAAINQGLARVR